MRAVSGLACLRTGIVALWLTIGAILQVSGSRGEAVKMGPADDEEDEEDAEGADGDARDSMAAVAPLWLGAFAGGACGLCC
jgi:hypothetical protein